MRNCDLISGAVMCLASPHLTVTIPPIPLLISTLPPLPFLTASLQCRHSSTTTMYLTPAPLYTMPAVPHRSPCHTVSLSVPRYSPATLPHTAPLLSHYRCINVAPPQPSSYFLRPAASPQYPRPIPQAHTADPLPRPIFLLVPPTLPPSPSHTQVPEVVSPGASALLGRGSRGIRQA